MPLFEETDDAPYEYIVHIEGEDTTTTSAARTMPFAGFLESCRPVFEPCNRTSLNLFNNRM